MRKRGKASSDASELHADTLDKLSAALKPVAPAPERAAQMRARIMQDTQANATEVVRAGEGEWKKLLPGITIKTLHLNSETGIQTSLWRLAAGARIPPHPHSKDEECLVLEGSIEHDGQLYNQGDFLYARPGMRHKDFIAPQGALLMIRGERIPHPLLLKLAMMLPH